MVEHHVGDHTQEQTENPRARGESADPGLSCLGQFGRRVGQAEQHHVQHERHRRNREQDVNGKHQEIHHPNGVTGDEFPLEPAADFQQIHHQKGENERERKHHRGAVTLYLAGPDEVHPDNQRQQSGRVDCGDQMREKLHLARCQRRVDTLEPAGEGADNQQESSHRESNSRLENPVVDVRPESCNGHISPLG